MNVFGEYVSFYIFHVLLEFAFIVSVIIFDFAKSMPDKIQHDVQEKSKFFSIWYDKMCDLWVEVRMEIFIAGSYVVVLFYVAVSDVISGRGFR